MKHLRFLFTPLFTAILFIIMAVAMAAATFIGNGYGHDTARTVVYNTFWFEFLFLLLAVNLTGQIIILKLYRKEKLAVMLLHCSFIIIIIGAAITKYTGYYGTMHIREGEELSVSWSPRNEVTFQLFSPDGKLLAGHSAMLNASGGNKGKYRKTLRAEGRDVTLTFEKYIRGAVRQVAESDDGIPMAELLVTTDMVSSETMVLAMGETTSMGRMTVGLGREADLMITVDSSRFLISSDQEIRVTDMHDMQSVACKPDTPVEFTGGKVYSTGGYMIMPKQLTMSGTPVPAPAMNRAGTGGVLEFTLDDAGEKKKIYLWNDNEKGSEWKGQSGPLLVEAGYGSMTMKLPFSLKLDDFIMERYPGSDSPSAYISRVTLADPSKNRQLQYDIYMNHILKYRGYRFYQSSYDNDEKGTVLSVNHDSAGTGITYAGYALLFISIILSLVSRSSFFRKVRAGCWNSPFRKPVTVMVLLMIVAIAPVTGQRLVIDRDAADDFGKVLAQDQKGRTKPLYTISSDILRKVAGRNSFEGMSPMQVFLGCSLDFYHWQDVSMIKVSNRELRETLGLKGERIAFSDLVTLGEEGEYRLSPYVEKAYAVPVSERTRFDREVIKLDERLNICYMMANGDFMHIFPMRDGSSKWGSAMEAEENGISGEDSLFVADVVPLWAQSVMNNRTEMASDEFVRAIRDYQRLYAGYNLPSDRKVNAELFYYKAKIFERLFPFYAAAGLIMIILVIVSIIKGKEGAGLLLNVLAGLVAAGFLFHTAGLAIRWYISGHSPLSNGYETMLFISWVTVLAGLIFSRRSLLTLAATSVLAGLTLMVAHFSFMDPEITNLVPVLRSYLLTLHVSVITASYGFLGLGAILGLIVLIMMLFVNSNNIGRFSTVIDELTVINYRSLVLGLCFLTAGTFLGAIWANESWGRYWGWDPKETWSLITILVYAFVTHSRLIPGMKDIYIFNMLSLFAFLSVLMTCFGVNYYLSGLHSYAGGDAASVPAFVYVAATVLVAVAVAARLRELRVKN